MKNLEVGDSVKIGIGVYYNYNYIPPNSTGIIKGMSLKNASFFVDFTINNGKICVEVIEDVLEKISNNLDTYDESRNPINNDDITNLKILLETCGSVKELIDSI
jgi:hypothetical protein